MQAFRFESKSDLLKQIKGEALLSGSLLFCHYGEGVVAVNQHQLKIEEGRLFSLPLFSKVALQCSELFSGWILKFEEQERKELLIHSFPLFCPFTGIVQLNLDEANFDALKSYLGELIQKQQGDFADEQLARMFSVLIIKYLDLLINEESAISQVSDSVSKKFVTAVGNGFRVNHNVEHYAEQIGTTTKTLTRRLKESVGITPKEIISYRINSEAMRIFASDEDLSVKEVAYQLGFSSTDGFQNFFKRLNKISPAKYKQQLVFMSL